MPSNINSRVDISKDKIKTIEAIKIDAIPYTYREFADQTFKAPMVELLD